ncbi:MAG: hypothetical protein E7522_03905 [Ruminococcaceae bacterium]|nr:hypothetical protein [Oscillospiraceae bacterium]
MKKAVKSSLTLIVAFIMSLVSANTSFAAFIFQPDYHLAEPTNYNVASVSGTSLEDVLDTEAFVDYLIEQLKVVDCTHIIQGSSKLFGYIDISQFEIPYSDEMWSNLRSLIWYNSPELFRIYSMGCSTSSGKISLIAFAEYYTKEDYAVMLEEMYSSADKLLNGIKGNENLDDVEKALLLHDRLALLCEYDYDSYLAGNVPESSYNAYGVFVLNDAVCKGYALAYDYLLEQVDIKSDYCASDDLNHAWNIVYINDIPYHVDVTWDDPVWDVSGRVTHENFLRSTNGIIETGHKKSGETTIDYTSTPTDTTYDEYFWQNSETAFQLLNDKIYYFNRSDKNIYLLKSVNESEIEVVKNLPYKWSTGEYAVFLASFSKLICDGEYLYYNTPDTVMRYDPETQTDEVIFKPDLTVYGNYFWIYGLNIKNDKIICEIYSSPNFNSSVKANYTLTSELYKEIYVADEKSVIDKENNIIFSENDACQSVEEICKTAEDITYNVEPSSSFGEYSYLGTGTVVTLYKNEEKIAEYTIVIDGDLDGDSVCDALDISLAELSMNKNRTPSEIECYAANGMAIAEINIDSFQYVVNTALG